MSTSLLYHAFGIRGYHYTRTDYQDGRTIFTIHQEPDTCRCSACRSPQVQHVRHVAIDEIAIAKGHRYLTVVLDLDSGAVVFVGDGKGAKALQPFWKRLRPSKAKIEAVAMDMSAAYCGAVSTHLPKAK